MERETTNEHLPDPDFDYDDEEEDNDEPNVWCCYSCGKVEGRNPGGFGCPRCGSIMEPDYI
jgi:hypothetical protein